MQLNPSLAHCLHRATPTPCYAYIPRRFLRLPSGTVCGVNARISWTVNGLYLFPPWNAWLLALAVRLGLLPSRKIGLVWAAFTLSIPGMGEGMKIAP